MRFPAHGGPGNPWPSPRGSPRWRESVNVSALGNEVRRGILRAVKDKLGFAGACGALGAKSSLHRYLSGERRVPDDAVRRALGLVRGDGTVDYGLALRVSEARYEDLLAEADD